MAAIGMAFVETMTRTVFIGTSILFFSGIGVVHAGAYAPAMASMPDDEMPDDEMPDDEMSDDEMAQVSGGSVVMELNLRNNVDSNAQPVGCTPVLNTPNKCRFGLEFADRGGYWLMLKEYFGTFHINDIRLDVGFLPTANTAYYSPARFMDVAGSCIIAACNPAGMPSLQLSYPAADVQNVYNDFTALLNVGRTWIETDSGPVSGFDRDTSLNSVFSARMSDSSALNAPARMRFLGTANVYGF